MPACDLARGQTQAKHRPNKLSSSLRRGMHPVAVRACSRWSVGPASKRACARSAKPASALLISPYIGTRTPALCVGIAAMTAWLTTSAKRETGSTPLRGSGRRRHPSRAWPPDTLTRTSSSSSLVSVYVRSVQGSPQLRPTFEDVGFGAAPPSTVYCFPVVSDCTLRLAYLVSAVAFRPSTGFESIRPEIRQREYHASLQSPVTTSRPARNDSSSTDRNAPTPNDYWSSNLPRTPTPPTRQAAVDDHAGLPTAQS